MSRAAEPLVAVLKGPSFELPAHFIGLE